MKKHITGSILLILFLIISTTCYSAKQDQIKKRLFKKVNSLFAQARSEQSDLLSPNIYKKAVKKNEDALEDLDKGKNIEKKLLQIQSLLQESLENAKLAKITFPHLLKAREDALAANAPQYALDEYSNAEELLANAAKEIEDGDIRKAKDKAINAEKSFRRSELLAIKSSIIGNVKNLIKKADDTKVEKYAPLTLLLAKTLLQKHSKVNCIFLLRLIIKQEEL